MLFLFFFCLCHVIFDYEVVNKIGDVQIYEIFVGMEAPVAEQTQRLMKKRIFKLLVKVNNKLLPSYTGKDPATLTKGQQAILGFRYWALINSL
ncbi:hypothetical protein GCM10007415_23870 [Parapedobacter pyrenivorans]|uniref:Uncharacterized protein n=1 Tax=Parapedobacter pyrenivorans TaxID=1305674 RepID=A0A917MCT8_9SPHI|nr:hypothetical protein GCM10007415_23870 [Parapedobacter pyrenivorans]